MGALAAAQRLVARELERPGAPDSRREQLASALHRAWALVVQNLRESIGDDGCEALFGRAIARSEGLHPMVRELRDPLRGLEESAISRKGLSDAVAADEAATRAAVEILLATLIEILARLIGEDMAIRIIDHEAGRNGPPPDTSRGRS